MPQSSSQPTRKYHALPKEQVLMELKSSAQGLSNQEAERRLREFGRNELPAAGRRGPLTIFMRQVRSLMTYVLLAAAGLSAFFAHWLDASVITLILVINIFIGFIQEFRAERSLEALRKMLVLKAKVYRDGRLHVLPAVELVPGDIILLEDGDKIPADARILQSRNLQASEASLTGESFPVEKSVGEIEEKTGLADRTNMVWMGTLIVRGTAEAVVTGTGLQTAMGDIARELARIEVRPGHFERRMRRLTQQMAGLAIGVAALTFAIGVLWRGFPVEEMLVFATAALVSGIPEGLPVILVLILAVGSHRMSKRNAIVRQLSAIETLGAVTVVVTDKTGTLTQNKMAVRALTIPRSEAQLGEGDAAFLESLRSGTRNQAGFRILLHIAAVCNSVRRSHIKDGPGGFLGDPTEVALVEFARSLGVEIGTDSVRYTKIDDLGFEQEKRWRACLVEEKDRPGRKMVFAVGAPEAILKASTHLVFDGKPRRMTPQKKREMAAAVQVMSERAMRVISLAYKEMPPESSQIVSTDISEMTYVGSAGIIDPPRPEVLSAIHKARQAGVRVVMATGDHPNTALAIAKQIGLLEEVSDGVLVNGADLEDASPEEFDRIAKTAVVCARFTPNIKLRLAEALQRQGHIVAMTGDGVNDAPALKQADVGISMAITGTEVARESSEVVLADDNFASIISAIEEGRTQFRNARRATLFLVTTNVAESAAILTTIFVGWPLPLLATQILWLNLVTDGVTDIALAVEPTHEDVLQSPPRDTKEQILTAAMLPFLLINTVIMVTLTVGVFWLFMDVSLEKARTGAFAVLAWTQLFNVLNMRSLKNSVFQIGLFSNKAVVWALVASAALLVAVLSLPAVHDIFSFVELTGMEMVVLFLVSSLNFWAVEVYKWFCRRTGFCRIA